MSAPGRSLPTLPLQPAAAGPLQGIRVVDLSRLVAGNMLTLQLGDFGADVIKVEAAGSGDTLREWREEHADFEDGFDGWWRTYARNKRSLALDLRNPAAMAWLRRLIGTAQVLVESFRPGTLEAMGLGPDALLAAHPGLVIVRLSGWGQTGPYRELPGFGSLIEGFSGFAHKHRGATGTPQLPNLALADMVTGLTGAFATLAAVREVEVRGGRGQVVDLSLLEPMLAIMGPDVSAFAATGVDAEPGRKIASPRGSYRCNDGLWVSMSGSTDTMARRVFEAIGQAALFDDPRFATNAARLAHDDELDAMVARFIGGLSQSECLALFRRHGVTVGPIYAPPQLLADAHVAERGVYVRLDRGDGSEPTVMHQVTPRLQGTPGSIRRAAPRRGEHTRELLQELGATPAECDALQGQGGHRMSVTRAVKDWRSLLFLPATAEHLLPKAIERGADALVVDLEDAIPPDRKAAARPLARAAVQQLAARGARVVLRVNSEPALWALDLQDMPVQHLAAAMLPKVEVPAQLDAFAQALAARAAAGGAAPPPIAALLETPRGVLAAAQVAPHPALCALGFGAEDYAGALGVPPEPAALAWPAHQVLTCAHAYGLACWGLAASIAVVDDVDGFERSVRAGRAMGFTGSVCIHPRQVPIVNRGFSPSDAELAWAARVVAADEAARADGLGAVLVDGRMIDRPIVERARRWLTQGG